MRYKLEVCLRTQLLAEPTLVRSMRERSHIPKEIW